MNKKILKGFYCCPEVKMIDFIVKKQIYDSVITGKVNACNELNCIVSMFLTSFNVCFVFGYAYILSCVSLMP